jgi:hypothetical protein
VIQVFRARWSRHIKIAVRVLAISPVSDVGLTHLKGLAELSRVRLINTQVTDAGAHELKRALPGLRIDR